jgi:hypothetical protein
MQMYLIGFIKICTPFVRRNVFIKHDGEKNRDVNMMESHCDRGGVSLYGSGDGRAQAKH